MYVSTESSILIYISNYDNTTLYHAFPYYFTSKNDFRCVNITLYHHISHSLDLFLQNNNKNFKFKDF